MYRTKIFIIILFSFSFFQEEIAPNLYGDELFDYLFQNYRTTSVLSYDKARDTLYLRIDRINGAVEGVYTQYSMNLPDGVDPSLHIYNNGSGLDCEHVWPQSMYEGSSPMKSDMHHLRPAKTNVNSARSNKPFGEINDNQTEHWYWLNNDLTNIPNSNINQYSESASGIFEPREDRKGDLARSMFYFFTMYSAVANEPFFNIQKDTLYSWHMSDPPDQNEVNRTWAIAQYQNNKPNPYILDLSLVSRVFFNDNIIGDVNGDSIINVLDVVMIVNHVLGLNNLESAQIVFADLNSDSIINVIDIVILMNLILENR